MTEDGWSPLVMRAEHLDLMLCKHVAASDNPESLYEPCVVADGRPANRAGPFYRACTAAYVSLRAPCRKLHKKIEGMRWKKNSPRNTVQVNTTTSRISRQLPFLRTVFREIKNALDAIPGIICIGADFEVLHSDGVPMISSRHAWARRFWRRVLAGVFPLPCCVPPIVAPSPPTSVTAVPCCR